MARENTDNKNSQPGKSTFQALLIMLPVGILFTLGWLFFVNQINDDRSIVTTSVTSGQGASQVITSTRTYSTNVGLGAADPGLGRNQPFFIGAIILLMGAIIETSLLLVYGAFYVNNPTNSTFTLGLPPGTVRVFLLILVVLVLLLVVFLPNSWSNNQAVTFLFGLFSTVIGFYYGSRKDEASGEIGLVTLTFPETVTLPATELVGKLSGSFTDKVAITLIKPGVTATSLTLAANATGTKIAFSLPKEFESGVYRVEIESPQDKVELLTPVISFFPPAGSTPPTPPSGGSSDTKPPAPPTPPTGGGSSPGGGGNNLPEPPKGSGPAAPIVIPPPAPNPAPPAPVPAPAHPTETPAIPIPKPAGNPVIGSTVLPVGSTASVQVNTSPAVISPPGSVTSVRASSPAIIAKPDTIAKPATVAATSTTETAPKPRRIRKKTPPVSTATTVAKPATPAPVSDTSATSLAVPLVPRPAAEPVATKPAASVAAQPIAIPRPASTVTSKVSSAPPLHIPRPVPVASSATKPQIIPHPPKVIARPAPAVPVAEKPQPPTNIPKPQTAVAVPLRG